MNKKPLNFSDIITYIDKSETREIFLPGDGVAKNEIMPDGVSRDHLLNLFAAIYKEHAEAAIKGARSKARGSWKMPLPKRKEKFLKEVLKKDRTIVSLASQKHLSLEKLAEEMAESLDQFARLNEQLNLLVS